MVSKHVMETAMRHVMDQEAGDNLEIKKPFLEKFAKLDAYH